MKVVVIRPGDGGVGHVAAAVAAELRATEDHVVEVIARDVDPVAWRSLLLALRHRDEIRRADIVHVELGRLSLGAFWCAFWAALFLRARPVVIAHDVPFLVRNPGAGLITRGSGLRDMVAYRLLARTLDRPITKAFTRRVRSWGVLGADARRAAIAMGWTPVSGIRHGADPAVDPDVGTPGYVLFAGQIGASKGLDTLLAAWDLARGHVTQKLVIAASGAPAAIVDLRAATRGIDRINVRENLDDQAFRQCVASADVVVLPYRSSNPASGILMHCRAQGVPVIATHIPVFDDQVNDGVDGVLFAVGDVEALSRALQDLLGSPRLRRQLAAGSARSLPTTGWGEHVGDVRGVYAIGSQPRILHVTQPTDGGTAVVALKLVAAGADEFRSDLAAPPHDGIERAVGAAGGHFRPIRLVRRPAPSEIMTALRLRQMFRDVDVVVLHSSKAGAVGRLALMTMRQTERPKAIFIPHGWSWHVGGRAAAFYRVLERALAGKVDRIVAVSASEALDGERVLGSRRSIVVIPNGVDTRVFAPGTRKSVHAHDLIVCVGRLTRQKGQDLVIRAIAQLEDVRLRLVGEGPDEASLRALAKECGALDRVEFVGKADPRPSYQQADVVVVPSRWEGLSLSLLEAMASGATVLASPAAGGDVLNGAGVIVQDSTDAQAWARELAHLLSDSALRQRLGEAARTRAARDLDERVSLAAHMALWRELLV